MKTPRPAAKTTTKTTTKSGAKAPKVPLPRLPSGQGADIGLLLEGTYPYVSGGVSSWVHEIITGLPELTFGVVFLGSAPEDYSPIRYKLPPNLVHVETHYLSEQPSPRRMGRSRKTHSFEQLARLHDELRDRSSHISETLRAAVAQIETPQGVSWRDFLYSEETWHQICASYHRFCTSPSFVDYFWTVRTMHGPLFKMAEIAQRVPPFKVLHSVSTGYAGFLGSLLQHRRRCPYVLTEHGIYTKERKIDLAHADWIQDAREELRSGLEEDRTYVRRLWLRFFESIGRLAYAAADPIIALYEGNRARQISDGAAEARTRVIPNGIDLRRFSAAPREDGRRPRPIIGLIGRVVPIKDVRGFIRAMRSVVAALPEAEAWIVGPEDEDKEYARECHELVGALGLGGRVKFLGFQKPDEIFPQLGVTVLTSISEALPLVILESFASGVPVVATDVGSCRELIEGRLPEDRAIGPAGAVVPIASPEQTAAAIVNLLRDPHGWARARHAGLERVQRYYTREQMFEAYRRVYGTALEAAGRTRARAS
jgi:glycosyltransferase involved in cell wall biosynthesis